MIIVGVVVLLAIAVVAIPFLVPASQYKAQIERSASDALGRDFRIGGSLRFTLWPALGMKAESVTIANAPNGKAPYFASISELDIGVKIAPLLRGDVEVEKLVLKQPSLALEEDVGGKPNWIFEPKTPAAPSTSAQQQPSTLQKFGLNDVRIENGDLTYRDRLGKSQVMSKVNLGASLASLDAPVTVAGDFFYNANQVGMKLVLSRPRALIDLGTTPLELGLQAPKLDLALSNATLSGKDYAVAGKLSAKGPSLRQFAAWTGNPIGDGGGMGAFNVSSDLAMAGQNIALKAMSFTLDAAKGAGEVNILTDPTGKPPYVTGALALEALDVNPYLGPVPAAPTPAAAPAPTSPGAAPAISVAPPAAAAPTPKGVNVNAPWGNAPIDFSGLKAINADLEVTTKRLLFQKMKLDASAMDVAMKDGVLVAKLNRLALYGGAGVGVLTLDGRAAGVGLGLQLSVRGADAQSFLTDAMALDKIAGKADIDIAIKGNGGTQQVVMNNLSGNAKFAFQNGALKGIDLAQIAKDVKSALTGAARGPNAKTDFSEMGASFTIASGVAHTTDLKVANTVVSVAGVGDIDAARQTMTMKVTPTFLRTDLKGLAVPFNATGPWAKLDFKPDLGGAIGNAVQNQIDRITGGKSLDDMLGSLLGKKKPAQ
jgi:AsmA protein